MTLVSTSMSMKIKTYFRYVFTNATVARPQVNFCQYCLHGCSSEEVLKTHMERCKLHGVQRIKLPETGNKKGCEKVKFTKTEYYLRLHFVNLADFENVLCKEDWCEASS